MLVVGIGLVIFATLLGAFGSLLLKLGSERFSLKISDLLRNKQLFLGFLLYGLSTVPFIISLKFGPLSVMYPFVSLSYVWVAILSAKFLKEEINTYRWFGIILILIGVFLVGAGKG